MGRLPWIIWRDPWNHKGPYERERGGSASATGCDHRISLLWALHCWLWKRRKEPPTKACRQPLVARRGKNPDSPQEPPEEGVPEDTSVSAKWNPFQTSDLENWEGIHVYCFEALSLWPFITAATGNEYNGMKKWKKVLVAQLCPTVCDSMDFSPPGSSVHGILQQKYWSGLPFPSPGDLPKPGIEPGSLALQVDSLPSEPPGKPSGILRCNSTRQYRATT